MRAETRCKGMKIFWLEYRCRGSKIRKCVGEVCSEHGRPRSFCMRLRKRRGGLPVARPQTPHVPSCRLKPGTPRALVCVLKTHGKSHEFTRTANRDRRDGGRKWVMVMARGKINSRTYPGSNTRPAGPVKPGSPLSSGIRRYSITRSPSDFVDYVVLKARTNRTWSTSPTISPMVGISVRHVRSAIMQISAYLFQDSAPSRRSRDIRVSVSSLAEKNSAPFIQNIPNARFLFYFLYIC